MILGRVATVAIGLLCLAGAVFAGWRGARPWDPWRGPRLAPWRPIMVALATVAILMAVHLVNLMGAVTGGRVGP